MSKPRVVETPLDATEVDTLNAALYVTGSLLGGPVRALVLSDESGDVFLIFRPGDELAVAKTLAEIKWDTLLRLAEEHCP